jgi:nitrogen fixation protein NifQ
MTYSDHLQRYVTMEAYVGRLDGVDGTGESGLSDKDAGHKLGVRFTLQLEQDLLIRVRFQVFGCGYTIAACSAAAELSQGQLFNVARQVDAAAIRRQLHDDLPEERYYCADLAARALQAALDSAVQGGRVVQVELNAQDEEQGPRVTEDDPLYSELLDSPAPSSVAAGDRLLFASLLTVAVQDNCSVEAALGLSAEQLDHLLSHYFPAFPRQQFVTDESPSVAAPEISPDIEDIIFSYLPADVEMNSPALLLPRILVARSAHSGHLWVAMGLLKRPQLTAAVKRHIPALAAANNRGMRWKRFFFKQVCDRNGGNLCKTPNCGDCSDYAACFAPESEDE